MTSFVETKYMLLKKEGAVEISIRKIGEHFRVKNHDPRTLEEWQKF